MSVAGCKKSGAFRSSEFVGSAISTGFFHEDQRTIVGYEVVREKIGGVWIDFFEEPPEASTRDFRLLTGKAFDDPFRVFIVWFVDGSLDTHPIADMFDFAERDSGLTHAPRPRIHAQKEYLFFSIPKFVEILAMRFPSVVKRVVDMGDWFAEREGVDFRS